MNEEEIIKQLSECSYDMFQLPLDEDKVKEVLKAYKKIIISVRDTDWTWRINALKNCVHEKVFIDSLDDIINSIKLI